MQNPPKPSIPAPPEFTAPQSYAKLVASLRSGDVPTTEEFAESLAKIQEEARKGAPGVRGQQLERAQRRMVLLATLNRVEKHQLPTLIIVAESIRRELGMESILYKQMGNYI